MTAETPSIPKSKKQAAETLLQERLANVNHAILVVDETGISIGANDAFFETTHLPPNHVLGRPMGDFVTNGENSDSEELGAAADGIIRIIGENEAAAEFALRRIPFEVHDGVVWHVCEFKPTVALADDFEAEDRVQALKLINIATSAPGPTQCSTFRFVSRDNLQKRLESKWDDFSQLLDNLANDVLSDGIEAGDILTKTDNNDFVVAFEDQSPEEIREKTQDLSTRIHTAVLSEAFETKCAALDLGDGVLETAAKVKTATFDVNLSRGFGVAKSLSAFFGEQIANAQKKIIETFRSNVSTIVQSTDWKASTFVTPDGSATDIQGFAYCGNAIDLSALDIVEVDELAAIHFDLDLAHLSKTPDIIEFMRDTRAPLMVDVHFSTLRSPKFRQAYIGQCEVVREKIGKNLAFNMQEIPDGTDPQDILGAVATLKPFSKYCSVEGEPMAATPFGGHISLITWSYGSLMAHLARGGQLANRIERVHQHEARIVVKDVPNTEAAKRLRRFNIDLVRFDSRSADAGSLSFDKKDRMSFRQSG